MSPTHSPSVIIHMKNLPTQGPFFTQDPFLFCVYHKDQYPPAVNNRMEAPRRGNGMDFDPHADYRMYHGSTIPGFPQHPHRGFETITATITGLIDHADSVGNAGRYGQGDVQWMTAGAGVVHSEMFPLLQQESDNPLRLFQIWLNLPARSKMVPPSFAMFWNTMVPTYTTETGATVTLWAGQNYFQHAGENNAPLPPNDSWAFDPHNDVAIWHIVLPAINKGTVNNDSTAAAAAAAAAPATVTVTLPPAHGGADIHRSLFYVEGGDHAVTLNGTPLKRRVVMDVAANQEITLQATTKTQKDDKGDHDNNNVEFLMLQGRPIQEPVVQHGPFVMNTREEIRQAFSDYSQTEFGGWPWPRDDMVFPREKGRFAILNGTEVLPPDSPPLPCTPR